ncbi:pentapeptide repeat-containing protein [Escherichia albertii]
MTDGIYTSPHYLYKSNTAEDMLVKKTRKYELLKIFCDYKAEFIILFDDFYRSQHLPTPSPAIHVFFQHTHLIDAHFYRCKLIEHTVQFSFLQHQNITLLSLYVFDDRTNKYISDNIKISHDCYLKFINFLKINFNQEIYSILYTPETFYEACKNLQSFYERLEISQNGKHQEVDKYKDHLSQEIKKLIKCNIYPELYNGQCNRLPFSSLDENQEVIWQNFKTSNAAFSQLCEKLPLFKSMTNQLIEKSVYYSTENAITRKFDVVFSYGGDSIKEFTLLLPYNKSMEMYELNDQKIRHLNASNIKTHNILLSNIIIERSNLTYGNYSSCVLENISCFDSDLSNIIFHNGKINNLFIKKSNLFGASFTNTKIKNLLCEDIMPDRWTVQQINKHLSYGYAGLFKTLASINDKPARFEILIPLIHTLVRDNVKLKNDVFEELDKYMLDYEKNDPKMKKYLQAINECITLMKSIAH